MPGPSRFDVSRHATRRKEPPARRQAGGRQAGGRQAARRAHCAGVQALLLFALLLRRSSSVPHCGERSEMTSEEVAAAVLESGLVGSQTLAEQVLYRPRRGGVERVEQISAPKERGGQARNGAGDGDARCGWRRWTGRSSLAFLCWSSSSRRLVVWRMASRLRLPGPPRVTSRRTQQANPAGRKIRRGRRCFAARVIIPTFDVLPLCVCGSVLACLHTTYGELRIPLPLRDLRTRKSRRCRWRSWALDSFLRASLMMMLQSSKEVS